MLDPTATHLPVLEKLFNTHNILRVLEFGCGDYSTGFFHQEGCDLTSIEMQHPKWHDKIADKFPGMDLRLALGPTAWRLLPLNEWYDLIFVDGHGDSRPECIEWAKGHTDLIVAHDTEHPYYGWERADMSGFIKVVHDELLPSTTVWERI